MFVAETKIFQFSLNLVQSQSVCKWCIDVERFTSNLILLAGRLRSKSTHVMQTVAYLDKNNTNVVAHSKQKLLEILSLC